MRRMFICYNAAVLWYAKLLPLKRCSTQSMGSCQRIAVEDRNRKATANKFKPNISLRTRQCDELFLSTNAIFKGIFIKQPTLLLLPPPQGSTFYPLCRYSSFAPTKQEVRLKLFSSINASFGLHHAADIFIRQRAEIFHLLIFRREQPFTVSVFFKVCFQLLYCTFIKQSHGRISTCQLYSIC